MMSHDTAPPADVLDPEDLLPFEDANDEEGSSHESARFRYLGEGLTAGEFTEYVARYDFGTIPPDFVVLHHTAVPSTLHTRLATGDVWDGGEASLSEAQSKARRQKKLNRLRDHYRDTLGWDRGPHLFIDDRYIWLFTPMRDEGIHAMWGNAFRDGNGYHYSIGIEVVGNYEQKAWPPEVARLVGHAVAVLKRRLQTFELRYLYPNGGPGRVRAGTNRLGQPIFKCAHPQRLRAGGITSHRDFNKPQCPGGAVTEKFYIDVLNAAWEQLSGSGPGFTGLSLGHQQAAPPQPAPGSYTVAVAEARIRQGPGTTFPEALDGAIGLARDTTVEFDTVVRGEAVRGNPWWGHLNNGTGFVAMTLVVPKQNGGASPPDQPVTPAPTPPAQGAVTADAPLMGPPQAPLDRCQRYLVAHPHGVYSDDDVRFIARLYFETCEPVGLDPLLVIAQMALETGHLSSDWSQPPKRNPAGIGVTGEPGSGLQFPNWPTAVRAHVGRVLAYSIAKGAETPAQSALIGEALGWRPLPDHLCGVAPTLRGLTGRWATDPRYADSIARVANEIRNFGE